MPVWALYIFNILAFMSQENENIEVEEVLEEELTEEVESDTEDTEINWKEQALKYKERYEKSEQAIVKNKNKARKQPKPDKKSTVSKFDSQVDLLRFNGITAEEIEKLKRIATLDNTDLIEARNSEDFTIWKERIEKDKAISLATTKTTNRGTVSKESIDKIKTRVMAGNASKEDRARVLLGKE